MARDAAECDGGFMNGKQVCNLVGEVMVPQVERAPKRPKVSAKLSRPTSPKQLRRYRLMFVTVLTKLLARHLRVCAGYVNLPNMRIETFDPF